LTGSASRESLPVTCISWSAASAYCGASGKRLPSEAEYEYLAGALRSDLFVWGTTNIGCAGATLCEHCADSVWGRNYDPGSFDVNSQCRPRGEYGGPLPAGNGRLDRLPLDGGEVLDLMGNVSEWTRDSWNRISEPCWVDRALLDDPSCQTPSTVDVDEDDERYTVKGSSWFNLPSPAANRLGASGLSVGIGFRCVRGG
jgi:formylglycine-generating enzyme required for sulfatase activity